MLGPGLRAVVVAAMVVAPAVAAVVTVASAGVPSPRLYL